MLTEDQESLLRWSQLLFKGPEVLLVIVENPLDAGNYGSCVFVNGSSVHEFPLFALTTWVANLSRGIPKLQNIKTHEV